MSRILHISDLHLGEPTARQYLDDHKSAIASADRRAEHDVLVETIKGLEAEGALGELDAVVISGDLANQADPSGFAAFAELAALLSGKLPAEQILVVPGNHDVPKAHQPGDPERYTEFLGVTRGLGLATPLLDGLDFDPAGALSSSDTGPHLVRGEGFEIVPFNSSHFCWGAEPLPDKVFESFLTDVPREEVEEATKSIRSHDIPRISNAQMAAVAELLAEAGADIQSDAERPLRIAVLHHQLLPIGAREEFKSFESLTNLGAVREFLVSLGFQVVLHGHKHESALYWDYVADQRRLGAAPLRLLVNAAPGTFRPGMLVGRIFETGARRAAPELAIEDIFAPVSRGVSPRREASERARLWDSPRAAAAAGSRVIRGESPSDVYARVQSVFAGVRPGEPMRDLVCEITDPTNAELLPSDYPPRPDLIEAQAWMTDLVDWWQLPEPQLGHGVVFNHGERIYKRWGDQVKGVCDLLSASLPGDPLTTRASILLLDPRTESSPRTREFPSFVSVHFELVPVDRTWRLDCTGHFRKQEMRYWWPINVAELARIQKEVLENVAIENHQRPRAGLLRTITAHAIVEERLPAVAVPAVDRAVDQRPQDLWRMAHSITDPTSVIDAPGVRRTWARYLEELRPSDRPDEPPEMPRRGLQMVFDFVRAVDPELKTDAAVALGELVGFYGLFRTPADASPKRSSAEAAKLLDGLDSALDEQLGPSSAAPGSA